MRKKFRIALLCGGPSLERGISLNSARSVCDHLQGDGIEIIPFYFDHFKKAYEISVSQLYSNTPSDFDFKLHSSARPLNRTALKERLKSVHLAFPAMHGRFGEDGEIQSLLEKYKIPFVGPDAQACEHCFDKFNATQLIARHGFHTIPSLLLESHQDNHKQALNRFFRMHNLDRAIVKPARGGSSLGVFSVQTATKALKAARNIFHEDIDNRVVVESFCQGIEFTVIILQNQFDQPVALIPTEIEMDYSNGEIFDYRKKYLATNQAKYHCPPRFGNDIIEKIQYQAEQLFQILGVRDFSRFDGWVLNSGDLLFSDFNPISGMEQNSFLFQQSSRIGMSHRDILRSLVRNACRRYDIHFPEYDQKNDRKRKVVNVLFGGSTSERQVSLMSGTNVWLKLRRSEKFEPHPYLLDTENNVWKLPYAFTLNHTVEEIKEMCEHAEETEHRLQDLRNRVLKSLKFPPSQFSQKMDLPEKMSLSKFIDISEMVFVTLHGGMGEDGTIQKMLTDKLVKYTGPGVLASQLCIDKYRTGEALKELEKEGIYTAPKELLPASEFSVYTGSKSKSLWRNLYIQLGLPFIQLGSSSIQLDSPSILVKPRADGCSTGVARLYSYRDLNAYIKYAAAGARVIPEGVLTNQHGIIEMPTEPIEELMFEPFMETDTVQVIKNKLRWIKKTGWIEITVGMLGKGKKIKALNPSLTVSTRNIVSLEEKFQGGTGINITPPPHPVTNEFIGAAKKRMEKVAKILGISGYARIDAFLQIYSGELLIIEANTNPGLTPSTVIYHQALAEHHPLSPTAFLDKILEFSF